MAQSTDTKPKVKMSSLKVDANGILIDGNTGGEVIGFFSNQDNEFLEFYCFQNNYMQFIMPVVKTKERNWFELRWENWVSWSQQCGQRFYLTFLHQLQYVWNN